jgi:RNA polymerase sigma-70 factor (ECF subfamily)
MRAFANKLERNSDRANDLVQETVVKALAGRSAFDGMNMRSWLFTIMKNMFCNSRRKDALRRTREAQVSNSAAGVWRAAQPMPPDAVWAGRDAERALDSLIPEFKDVVMMVGLEGLRYREAAKALGCPLGTIMSRLHRARAAFVGVARAAL